MKHETKNVLYLLDLYSTLFPEGHPRRLMFFLLGCGCTADEMGLSCSDILGQCGSESGSQDPLGDSNFIVRGASQKAWCLHLEKLLLNWLPSPTDPLVMASH